VATWLVTNVSVRKPNSSENSAPTTIAASTPSQGEPVVSATPNPVTAPMTIMPSTPRLRTPERSTTSSPIAAMSSGVAAVAIVMMTCSSILDRLPCLGCLCLGRRRAGNAHAVVDQRVAGEHEEEQHALEGAHGLVGNAERDLRRLAAEIGQRQDDARGNDAERSEPAEKSDDGGGEAVTDRDFLVEVLDRTGNLGDAGKTGERAGQHEDEEHHLRRGETGEAPCPRTLAKHLNLEALERLRQHEPDGDRRDQREDEAPMRAAGIGPDLRQDRVFVEADGAREAHAFRIAPDAAHQPVVEELGDVDQHQAGQYLVGVELHLAEGR